MGLEITILETILAHLPGREILWIIFALAMIGSLIATVILNYHWRKFNQELSGIKIKMHRAQTFYYAVTGTLLFTMLLAILFYPQ